MSKTHTILIEDVTIISHYSIEDVEQYPNTNQGYNSELFGVSGHSQKGV